MQPAQEWREAVLIKHDRIKIHLVRPEQKISRQPLSGFREVRLVTLTKGEGVRVDYFDGGTEWFPVGTLVYTSK